MLSLGIPGKKAKSILASLLANKALLSLLPRIFFSVQVLFSLLTVKKKYSVDDYHMFSILFGLSFWVLIGDFGYQLTVQKLYTNANEKKINKSGLKQLILKKTKTIFAINLALSILLSFVIVKVYFNTITTDKIIFFYIGLFFYIVTACINIASKIYYFENNILLFLKKYSVSLMLSNLIIAFFFFGIFKVGLVYYLIAINAPIAVFLFIIFTEVFFEKERHKKNVLRLSVKEFRIFSPTSFQQLLISILAITASQLDILILAYVKIDSNLLTKYIFFSRFFTIIYTLFSTRIPLFINFFNLSYRIKKFSAYEDKMAKFLKTYFLLNILVLIFILIAVLFFPNVLRGVGIIVDNYKLDFVILLMIFVLTLIKGVTEVQAGFLTAIFQQKMILKLILFQATIGFVLQFLLGRSYGIVGILTAMICSFAMATIFQVSKIKKLYGV